jgi:hypothetical protein
MYHDRTARRKRRLVFSFGNDRHPNVTGKADVAGGCGAAAAGHASDAERARAIGSC